MTEGFRGEDNGDSVHAVDKVAFVDMVDKVDLASGICSSDWKVHNVNKVNKMDKEDKVYRENIDHFW